MTTHFGFDRQKSSKILISSNLSIFSNNSSYYYRICCNLVSQHRIFWYGSTHRPIFNFYQNLTLSDYYTTSFSFDIFVYNLHFQRLGFPTQSPRWIVNLETWLGNMIIYWARRINLETSLFTWKLRYHSRNITIHFET